MKKIKFLPYRLQALYKVSFIILFFSLVGRPTYAESSDGKINDKSIQNQTTSGHSIELNGISLLAEQYFSVQEVRIPTGGC